MSSSTTEASDRNDWPAPEPIVDWHWADMDAQSNPKAQTPKEPSALSEGLHTVLDVVGMIPVVGEVADAANAAIYAAEGDYANAALSAASMVPLAGNVVGAAKLAKRVAKIVEKAKGLKKAVAAARKTAQQLAKGGRNVLKEVEGHIIETIPERALSFDKVRFTHKAVDKVANHLYRFGPFVANSKMIERLRGIADGSIQATDIDKRFLTHELREMVRMRLSKAGVGDVNGNPFNEAAYRAAHDATLREYGLFVRGYEKLLYHPDAIKAGEIAGDWF